MPATTLGPRRLAPSILSAAFLTLATFAERGIGRRGVATLVRHGRLLRLRNGRFVGPEMHPELVRAGRLGGRLDCLSLLAALGVFVRSVSRFHVQFEPGTTRLPPRDRDVVAHWRTTRRARERLSADLVDALVQACRCQTPRDAVATLDSAWHHRLVTEAGINEVFRRLPRRFQILRDLLEPRSESGAETLLRLMLRSIGADFAVQVGIPGVGRVDFVVDGWLIIECDSRAHHSSWAEQKRDRRRDLAAAALGYTTIRPIAEDIFGQPEAVQHLVVETLAHPPRRNSTGSRRRAGSAPARARI